MCIPQQYINLVSVVERFFVHPLYRKRVNCKGRHPDQMSKDSFSTPLVAFFDRHGSPVPSDQDV
jgi:hypothetical protein